MAHFPFWDRYPYTNFEALNLDYLLNETSKFSKRVSDLETITANHEVRIGTLETNVEDLTGRVGTLETEVGDLKDRMTEAESDIDNLQGRMNDVEDGIEALDDRVDTLEDDMSTAKGDITDIKGDIVDINGDIDRIDNSISEINNKDQAQDNDIDALDLRVSSLEGHSVVANPGGTGANLNTLAVDNVTYVIPSGGGGSGTTVTANPAGVLPTDPELSALGIDALNYRIPVTSSDKEAIEDAIDAIEGDVEDLKEAVLDIDTRIGTIVQRSFASGTINNWAVSQKNEVVELDGDYYTMDQSEPKFDSTITLNPGVYLLTFECDYNTTPYGSNARFLGGYIRNKTTHAILARGKFSVFGNERAMITQAASINCMAVVVVPEGETLSVVAAVRCNSAYDSSPMHYTIDNVQFNAVRLGVVA